MPAGRLDLVPSESPGGAGDHPAWVYIRAEPAAVYIAPPLGPQRLPPETVLRLDARLLPDSRHRRRHCLHWLSLLPKPATVHRAGICGQKVKANGGSAGVDGVS